MYFGNPLSEK